MRPENPVNSDRNYEYRIYRNNVRAVHISKSTELDNCWPLTGCAEAADGNADGDGPDGVVTDRIAKVLKPAMMEELEKRFHAYSLSFL